MSNIKINLAGREVDIDVSRQGNLLTVTVDGESTEARLVYDDGSTFILEWVSPEGRQERVRVAGHAKGDRRQLWVNGRTFKYERVRQRRHVAGQEGESALEATIPSVVSEVLVKVGDRVQRGDKLILLESMKMIIPIQSPRDGVVVNIACAAGDSVQPGVQLIEIEES